MSPIEDLVAWIKTRSDKLDELAERVCRLQNTVNVEEIDRLHDLDKRLDAVKAGAAEAASLVVLKNQVRDLNERVDATQMGAYQANDAFRDLRHRVYELEAACKQGKVTVDAEIEKLKGPCWKDSPDALGIWVLLNEANGLSVMRLDHPASLRRPVESRAVWYGPLPDYEA
jgi:chromosome segregation ATPase